MKKIILAILALVMFTMSSCENDDDPAVIKPLASCADGIQNQGEAEVDCGGPNCQPCAIVTATCNEW